MKSSQIGLQLYTVRDHAAGDMVGTLRRAAEMGYGAVEFAGWGSAAPREIRDVLEGEGITPIAAHVALVDLETRPMSALGECELVGCEWVVVPSVTESWLASVDDVTRLAERLNSLGTLAHAAGLKLAFHNHDAEFREMEGTTAWDVLLHETEPGLVDFELDVYWAAYAGAVPLETLRLSGRRVRMLHARDLSAAPERREAAVGEGTLPWREILDVGDERGVGWYIVEQDESQDPFEDAERSLRNLRRVAGLPV